jgi:hypothetical protein
MQRVTEQGESLQVIPLYIHQFEACTQWILEIWDQGLDYDAPQIAPAALLWKFLVFSGTIWTNKPEEHKISDSENHIHIFLRCDCTWASMHESVMMSPPWT